MAGRGAAASAAWRRSMPSSQPGRSSGTEGEQQIGIGMQRRLKQRRGGAGFDLLPGVEDHDVVADRLDRREVVADEHIGDAKLAAQLIEQLEDRRADHRVERRGHLVAEDAPRARRSARARLTRCFWPPESSLG